MDPHELAAWLRLTLSPGVGNTAVRKLLAAFGLPQAIFEQPLPALLQVVTPAQAKALQTPPAGLDALLARTQQWLQDSGPAAQTHAMLTLGDAAYPAALLAMEDPPLVLYTLGAGALSAAQLERSIAIVGSRNPTAQGAQNARAFAHSFSASGLTVVSGLALGIDGAAHEGALDGADPQHPLSTLAVVGTGLDRVYPRRHLALAHRITQNGLLLSEYPLGTPPLAANFPKRNRLIAGLSCGTLVVEAAQPSGSLITARLAAEQGKEVFAIPGSIHAPQSRGCHALIKQGAKLVESAQDVLEELHVRPAPSMADSAAPDPADPDGVLAALGFDPAGLDALVARTGVDAATLQVRLLELELDGLVARLPGGLFQRITST